MRVQCQPMREAQRGSQEKRQKRKQIKIESMTGEKKTQTAKQSNKETEGEKKKEAERQKNWK